MQKIKILLLFSIIAVAVIPSRASADAAVVFNSGPLTISRLHMHLSMHTIEVNQPAEGILHVSKDTPDIPIRAGFVIFNRRLIPLKNFFRSPETTFERKIRLRQRNKLRVFLIGSPGASITITVESEAESQPQPTITFRAEPETIELGASGMLEWFSENADTCTIAPNIGDVDITGSMAVSPSATTTYTITASGPGGSVTTSATVTVVQPPPTITFSATPTELIQGASSTLTWDTVNADAVYIDQGIGQIQVSGTVTVFPQTDTTYTITASGPGGTSNQSVTITVAPPLSIQIISPEQAATIHRSDTMVRGTFINSSDGETGVTVNGIAAMVLDNQFVANHVPLEDGENTISVSATTSSGKTADTSIVVYSENNQNEIRLTSDTASGVIPFETRLRINGPLANLSPTFTSTGPAAAIVQESDEANVYSVRLEGRGIYYFTAEVSDAQGNSFIDEVAIMAMFADELDALLQAKWSGMKTALISGDIDEALTFHHQRYSERYSAIYQALGDDLPALASKMSDISWICYTDGLAKYRIRQDHDVNGQMVTITYYIYFSRGRNGLWKIERY